MRPTSVLCSLALLGAVEAYQPSSAGVSRRSVFQGLGWTGAAAAVGAPTTTWAAPAPAPAPVVSELVSLGAGPLVKDGGEFKIEF